MKFLIENFTTYDSTLPLFLNKELEKNGHESLLWSQKECSTYDIFDQYQPDIFITHAKIMSKDYIDYCNNNERQIKLLLDVSNLSQKHIFTIEEQLLENNLQCEFMFCHLDKHNIPITKKNRVISLLNCADTNLLNNKKPPLKYNVDKAIFINHPAQVKPMSGSYHYLTVFEQIRNNVDICLPVMDFCNIYHNYDEIIFRSVYKYIPQSFFDALLHGNKVYYDADEENYTTKTIDLIFKDFGSLNYKDKNRLQDFSGIKEFIKSKHAPANRLKTLLSQMPKDK